MERLNPRDREAVKQDQSDFDVKIIYLCATDMQYVIKRVSLSSCLWVQLNNTFSNLLITSTGGDIDEYLRSLEKTWHRA